MKISDYYFSEEPTFSNRLLYAKFLNPYDCYSDSKWGYLDGARELEETNKTLVEIEEYIKRYEEENKKLDEYDKAYILAYKDFLKEKMKEGVTNE